MITSPLSISASPLALLGRLLSKLDLTATQREDLERSYKSVTAWLLASSALKGILRSLELRPQGSVRAGTVVRPSGQHDFDLDFLCWMDFLGAGEEPSRVWQRVWDALGEHGVYKSKRIAKPRCIRLQFEAGYHLDITPAVPDPEQRDPSLRVADSKANQWSPSNPIGFCDHWLAPIAAKLPPAITSFNLRKALSSDGTVVANRKDTVEALPSGEDGFRKEPLLKIIQLIKYLRDQAYPAEDKLRPSSILLTTITARAYERELLTSHSALTEFVIAVVSALKSQVGVSKARERWHFSVINPVHAEENFADSWTLETYGRFASWADELAGKVAALLRFEGPGLDARIGMFNATIPGAAGFHLGKEIGDDFRKLHDSRRLPLRAIPGVAASAAIIRPTTFFGMP